MGMSTVRRFATGRPETTTYWRRRFVALVIGLSIVAVLAWVLSGALGGSIKPVNTADSRPLHHHALSSPPAATPPRAGAPAHTTSHSHSNPTRRSVHKPAGSVSHRHKPARGALTACPSADVVLSLFATQVVYSQRQTPEFRLDVVSTASHTCTFNVGARHLWLQIDAGKRAIWTSRQCAEGPASVVTDLRRGVPTVVTMTWDKHKSSAGCPVPGPPARRGAYDAVAGQGVLRSNTLVFRIT